MMEYLINEITGDLLQYGIGGIFTIVLGGAVWYQNKRINKLEKLYAECREDRGYFLGIAQMFAKKLGVDLPTKQ